MTFLATSVVQFYCYPSWHGNAVRTIGVCIRRLGYGHHYYHLIWFRGVLYVGYVLTLLALLLANDLCSAKILARIILSDPRIRSYSDIGRKAFGPVATPIISFMFCLELFAVRSVRLRSGLLSRLISCRSVCLVTLYGDSLHSLLPQHPSNYYKALGLVL